MNTKLISVHPGEILTTRYLKALNITVIQLAGLLKVSPSTLYQIVGKKKPITAPIAVKLSIVFGLPPQYWLNMQNEYDVEDFIRKEGRLLKAKVKPYVPSKT